MRPPLTKYQLDAIFCPERYAEIEATTKSGKTHGCLAWLFEQAATKGKKGRNFWWVAPVYSQAAIAYRRLKAAIPLSLRTTNDSEMSITLANGAVIWFKTGEKPDNLYGEDVYAMVIDEASRLREDAWHACRSTLTSTKGPVRIIGNVKGRKNWFFLLCRKAQAGEKGHRYTKITWRDGVAAGIINGEEVEQARRDLPANVFKELFEAEPSDDTGNPFGIAAIRGNICPVMSPLAPIAFGVDLAKSVDWTCVVGLDENGHVCRYERFQAPWTETIRRVRNAVGSVPAFVDSTGVGDPIVENLQRGDGQRTPNYEGYKFTSESKQKLMEGLAVVIQQAKIAYPAGVLVQELEAFEYEYTGRDGRSTGVRYSAPAGAHDDTVCALALAVACSSVAAGRPRWRPI